MSRHTSGRVFPSPLWGGVGVGAVRFCACVGDIRFPRAPLPALPKGGEGSDKGEDDLPEIQLLEEVVALVVDDDEGGEIDYLDAPDRLHAEFRIFNALDLLDAMLGEICRRAPDRRKIEAPRT